MGRMNKSTFASLLRALADKIESGDPSVGFTAVHYSDPVATGYGETVTDRVYRGSSYVIHDGVPGFPNDAALCDRLSAKAC
jgi:hypothetical protein